MSEMTNRITIEIAQNGFLVYINSDLTPGTVRKAPYVFETMESMQKFIKDELTKVY
jgi:hypothetical protein